MLILLGGLFLQALHLPTGCADFVRFVMQMRMAYRNAMMLLF